MAPSRKKLTLKLPLEPRRRSGSDDDAPQWGGQRWMRKPTEERSKKRNDVWHVQSVAKEKGKAIARSPPPKKRRIRQARQESESEEEDAVQELTSDEEDRSSGEESIDIASDGKEEDTMILEKEKSPHSHRKREVKKGKELKQRVLVDGRGNPYGKQASYLAEDLKLFAKQMNPCYGWADQPLHEKQRFFDRLYAEWEVGGQQTEINPAWFPQFATKALINIRHNLSKMIDGGDLKPAEVDPEVWDMLSTRRGSVKAKEKSEKMCAISKGKGSKATQMKAIEKTMIAELTHQLQRIPYPGEVLEATEKEYNRRQADARKVPVDLKHEIEFVRTEMQARTSNIGEHLSKMEVMIGQLMMSLGVNKTTALQVSTEGVKDVQGPAVLSNVGEGLLENVVLEQEGAEDVATDALENAIHAGDTRSDVAPNQDVDVDAMVDSITNVVMEKNHKGDVGDDIQHVPEDVPIRHADPDSAKDDNKIAESDIVQDSMVETAADVDPYAINMSETGGDHPLGDGEPLKPQEAGSLPSSGAVARSNRAVRTQPVSKQTKFVAPTKVGKANASKVGKASPPRPSAQQKRGEVSRKK